jgi:hypothetical protein
MIDRCGRFGRVSLLFLTVVPLLWMLLACTQQSQPTGKPTGQATGMPTREPTGPLLQIVGIEIHNALPYTIQDVTILIPESGDFVSCGQVLPDSSCSTSFPVRDYRETAAQLNWKEQGEPRQTAPFILEAPETASEGQQAYIRVEVFSKGQAGAKLLLLEEQIP